MFGKKRFVQLRKDQYVVPMAGQKQRLPQAFADYQLNQARRDDLSVIEFSFS